MCGASPSTRAVRPKSVAPCSATITTRFHAPEAAARHHNEGDEQQDEHDAVAIARIAGLERLFGSHRPLVNGILTS